MVREGPFQRIVAVNFPDDDTGEHAPGDSLYTTSISAGVMPGYTGSPTIPPEETTVFWTVSKFSAWIWAKPTLSDGPYGWQLQYFDYFPVITGGNHSGGAAMRTSIGQPTTYLEKEAGVVPWIDWIDVSPTVGLVGSGAVGYNWSGTGCQVDVALEEYYPSTGERVINDAVAYNCEFSVFTLRVGTMLFTPQAFTFEVTDEIYPELELQFIGYSV